MQKNPYKYALMRGQNSNKFRGCYLIVLTLLMLGCNAPKIQKMTPDGKFISYSYYEDNQHRMHGEYVENYNTGSPKRHATYDHGIANGIYEEYHRNGLLFVKARYQEGALMEILSYQDSTGVPLPVGSLKNGEGSVNEFDHRGQLMAFGHLKEGWFHGYYYLNSHHGIIDSTFYDNGKASDLDHPQTLHW